MHKLSQLGIATPFLGLLLVLPFGHTVALRLLCLLGILAVTIFQWRQLRLPDKAILTPYLSWIALVLLATVLSSAPDISVKEFKNEILYTLIAFIGFLTFARSERQLDAGLSALVVSALTLTIAASVSLLTSGGSWQSDALPGGVGDYSSYFVYVTPLLVWWVTRQQSPWLRRLAVPIGILMLLTVLMTENRMALISLALEATVFCALVANARWRRLIYLAIPAILISAFLAAVLIKVPPNLDDHNAVEKIESVTSSDPRWQLWSCASERIASNPWMGYGFGRSLSADALAESCGQEQIGEFHAHNVFLDAGVQMGLPGMLALIWLFVAIGRRYWGYTRSDNDQLRQIGIVGLLFIVGVVSKNLTDDFLVRHHSLLFWAITGMLLGLGERLRGQPTAAAY